MMAETPYKSILSYNPGRRRWWERFFVEIPEDVQRRLAVAKAAQRIANDLAPLEPEANREILARVAELLGVAGPSREALTRVAGFLEREEARRG